VLALLDRTTRQAGRTLSWSPTAAQVAARADRVLTIEKAHLVPEAAARAPRD